MTSIKGIDIIKSGWRAAGITDAINLGLQNLPSIDPFDDIDPMLNPIVDIADQNNQVIKAVANLTVDELTLVVSNEPTSDNDSDDSDWEDPANEERGAFDIFEEELE